MSIRDEIRALCTEADRWLAEERDWLAQRQAQAWSPVNESDTDAGVVYKTIEDALQPAPEPEPDWSAWEAWMQGHLNILRQEMIEGVAEGMALFFAEKFAEKRHEIDRELAVLRAENAEIRGMLGATLMLLGKSNNMLDPKAADVVELPKFLRKTHVA